MFFLFKSRALLNRLPVAYAPLGSFCCPEPSHVTLLTDVDEMGKKSFQRILLHRFFVELETMNDTVFVCVSGEVGSKNGI